MIMMIVMRIDYNRLYTYLIAGILPEIARRVLPRVEALRRGADLLPPEINAMLEQKRRLLDARAAILTNGNPSDRMRGA
jgi:hypothetical protein